ncbi:MAG: hypothetical protein P8177_01010 [Gemmatimonadota bacterium]
MSSVAERITVESWMDRTRARLGLVGQVATSWGVAGGLLATVVVLAHVVANNLSAGVTFGTATLFYVVGSFIAFLHGGVVAYLGRPPEVTRQQALRRLALAVLYDVPVVLIGWLVAMLMTMSVLALTAGRIGAFVVSALGWVAGAGLVWWAVVETREVARHLFRRWPDARALVLLLGLGFLALIPVFVVTRPEVWVVGFRPSATTATFMALGATLWIGGPLVFLVVLGRRAWAKRHPAETAGVADGGA